MIEGFRLTPFNDTIGHKVRAVIDAIKTHMHSMKGCPFVSDDLMGVGPDGATQKLNVKVTHKMIDNIGFF